MSNGIEKRYDYELINMLITPKSSILDLGCGEGDLLWYLIQEKQIKGSGIEISSQGVQEAIKKGLSVIQADIEETISNYPDKTFDYTILSQTMQELKRPEKVISAMARISKRAIITFYNLAHFKFRLKILMKGQFPTSIELPFNWLSANIMFLSVADFKEFCKTNNYRIVSELYYSDHKLIRFMPNLRSKVCIFEIEQSYEA